MTSAERRDLRAWAEQYVKSGMTQARLVLELLKETEPRVRCDIRALRLGAGLTQNELAVLSDLSRNEIRRLERSVEAVTMRTLYKIAKALEVPVESLIDDLSPTDPAREERQPEDAPACTPKVPVEGEVPACGP